MDRLQTPAQTTEPGPDLDLFQAQADQIRRRSRFEGTRRRLYHEDRQTLIRRWIRRKFVALISLYHSRGDEIGPEFQSFEIFLSESRRRQREMAFRQEFDSFEDFLSHLRSRRRNDHHHASDSLATYSFEAFMCELDLFEEFMFVSDFCRLRTETESCPDPFPAFWFDLNAFDAFIQSSDESDSEESEHQLSDSDGYGHLACLPAILPKSEQPCPICKDEYHDDITSATAPTRPSEPIDRDTGQHSCNQLGRSPGDGAGHPTSICNHVLGKIFLQ